MPADFSVVITDFLEEASIEAAVLGDAPDITLAGGMCEADLHAHLADADALILFHEIGLVAAAMAPPGCKCIIRAGVGFNNVDRAAAAKHGVIVCNVPDYGTEEVADHAMMLLLALARKLLTSDARRSSPGLGLPHGDRYAPAPGQDAWRGRLRPDRDGDRAACQGAGAGRALLRPTGSPGCRQARRIRRVFRPRSCSSRATS